MKKIPDNISVMCLACTTHFVTGEDSFEDGTAKCPACGDTQVADLRE